jgi:hypothetical protein
MFLFCSLLVRIQILYPRKTMPKVSQSGRHTYRKQSPSVIPECATNSIALTRTTRPRKVSEEDIISSSCENSTSSDERFPIRPKGHLKRPMPSVCLVDLASANASISRGDSNAESCLSPHTTSSFPEDSDVSQGDAYPSSPWGHFVDLFITSSSYEGLDSSNSPRSFLPSHYCPNAPYKLNPTTQHTKRRRYCSSARPPSVTHKHQQSGELSSKLCGLSLSSRPSSASLLEAAQDAFNDCRL